MFKGFNRVLVLDGVLVHWSYISREAILCALFGYRKRRASPFSGRIRVFHAISDDSIDDYTGIVGWSAE